MKLVFEKGSEGRGMKLVSGLDVPRVAFEQEHRRDRAPRLPHLSENEISRHYTELAKRSHGVNDGFYPLGSCTMKYNPKVNDKAAALRGFQCVHPLQPEETVQGSMEVMFLAEKYLCEITGMDAMTFQPAAGAHGEFTGLLLIKAYHVHRNDTKRTKIIVPDSAHGTNPASAAMCGYEVVSIPSREDGCVDLEQLEKAVGEDTAGLMLTNPNTVGLFDKNILEITRIVHEAGGLCYYDGANLNAVMGIVRPGDMGFDVVHLNLHKTFSTPHGGGGPGSGPVGCKGFLEPYLPGVRPVVCRSQDGEGQPGGQSQSGQEPGGQRQSGPEPGGQSQSGPGPGGRSQSVRYQFQRSTESMGDVKLFYGNFLVVVKALAYILTLGREGIPEASANAVLNANYMKVKLSDVYDMAYDETCMHEFVMSLEGLKQKNGVTAMDIAKALLDYGIHPPTMYFPLIVHEALMVEPTETEAKETLDEAIAIFHQIYEEALKDPEKLHSAPHTAPIGRPDEVTAARKPVLRYTWD